MTNPWDAPPQPDARTASMDDYVGRALYYRTIAFDHNSQDCLAWEQLPGWMRDEFLGQAQTAIEAFSDWRHSRGLFD